MNSRINPRTLLIGAILIVLLMFRPSCQQEYATTAFPAQATTNEPDSDITIGNPAAPAR